MGQPKGYIYYDSAANIDLVARQGLLLRGDAVPPWSGTTRSRPGRYQYCMRYNSSLHGQSEGLCGNDSCPARMASLHVVAAHGLERAWATDKGRQPVDVDTGATQELPYSSKATHADWIAITSQNSTDVRCSTPLFRKELLSGGKQRSLTMKPERRGEQQYQQRRPRSCY